MHEEGHVGLALVVYAPVAFLLIWGGMVQTAIIGMVGVGAMCTAPDLDMRVPFVKHRGITHTAVAAVMGGILYAAAAAYFVWNGLGTTPTTDSVLVIQQHWLATLAGAGFGFFLGVLGVVAHLLGDVITPMGIKPWQPFDDTKYTLDLVYAKNEAANKGLLAVGSALTIVAVAGGTML